MRFARQTTLLTLLLGSILSSGTTLARQAIEPFEARYAVSAKGLKLGEMTRKLEISPGQTYRFTADFKTTGLAGAFKRVVIRESSTGEILGRTIRPRQYRYRKESGKKIEESGTDFDWTQKLATGFKGEQHWQLPLSGDEFDKVTYQLALAADLLAGTTVLDYNVPDAGKRQRFSVKREGTEVIALATGKVSTLRVAYRRRDGRSTLLWCDPARAFLPVQIEYREKDGGVTRATLDRLLPQEKTLEGSALP